jgi:hypothetical protein
MSRWLVAVFTIGLALPAIAQETEIRHGPQLHARRRLRRPG